jgi:hypothetical protein
MAGAWNPNFHAFFKAAGSRASVRFIGQIPLH